MKILIVSADRTDVHGGACNLGDAFLTDALASALGELGHDVAIYDFGSVRTTSDLPRISGGRLGGLASQIRAHDLVLIGGGTLFQDNEPTMLVGGLPRLCLTVATLARVSRRPHRFFGVGMDPIDRRAVRLQISLATARVPVWLREQDSCDRFSEYFGRSARLGADAALLTTVPPEPNQVPRAGLVIALNRSEAPAVTSELIEAARSRFGTVTFLAMDQQASDSDWNALSPDVRSALGAPTGPLGWREAAAQISSSAAVVASRMHALYMAALSEAPMIAVGTRPKVRSFASEFAIPHAATATETVDLEPRVAASAAIEDAVSRAATSLADVLGSV